MRIKIAAFANFAVLADRDANRYLRARMHTRRWMDGRRLRLRRTMEQPLNNAGKHQSREFRQNFRMSDFFSILTDRNNEETWTAVGIELASQRLAETIDKYCP